MTVPYRKINLGDCDLFILSMTQMHTKIWNEFRKKTSTEEWQVCKKVKKFLKILCTLLKQEHQKSSFVQMCLLPAKYRMLFWNML